MIWMDACDALSRLKRFVLSFNHVLTLCLLYVFVCPPLIVRL